MSEVIDNKVVQLEFDNKNFEKNVDQSISTIDKLKSSLNFDGAKNALSALQTTADSINFSNMANSLEYIASRMTPAAIAINSVISTIASNITNTIGGAITGVINQIKSGGISRAFKIENAKFSLAGLGVEWDKIYPSLDKAVTGTAYGLDSAATAASSLVASGVQLGDEMTTSLSSIASVAAQTNSEYDDIASIYTTIAGNGKLMSMQLQQLSTRGLNAAATLAKAMGKTETEVREMVSKGKIDFKTFSDAMYEAFGENAGKANETFEGILKNIKAAWSRIGQVFVTPLIEQNGPLVKMLQAYKDRIADVAKHLSADTGKLNNYVTKTLINYINQITKMLSSFNAERLYRSIYRFIKGSVRSVQALIRWLKVLYKAFKEVFPKSFLDTLLDVAKKFTKLTNSFYESSKGLKKNEAIYSKLVGIFRVLEVAAVGVSNIFKFAVQNVKAFFESFKENANVSSWIEAIGQAVLTVKHAIDLVMSALEKTNTVTAAGTILGKIAANIINTIASVIQTVARYVRNVVDALFSIDYSKFTNLKALIEGFVGVLKAIWGIIKGIVSAAKDNLDNFFGGLQDNNVFDTILTALDNFVGKIIEGKKKVDEFLSPLTEKLPSVPELFDKAKTSAEGFSKVGLFDSIGNAISKVLEKLKEFGQWVYNSKVFQAIKDGVVELLKPLKEFIDSIGNSNKDIGIFDIIEGFVESIASIGATAIEGVANAIKIFNKALGDMSLGDIIKDILLIMGMISIDTLVTDCDTIVSTINSMLKNISMSTNMYIAPIKNKFLRFAQAIAILVASVVVLSMIPEADLDKALDALIEIMAALGIFVEILGAIAETSSDVEVGSRGITKTKDPLYELSLAMVKIAEAIVGLAVALYIVGQIDPKRLDGALAAIMALMGELGIIAKLLSGSDKTSRQVGKLLKALASSVIEIALALYIVGKIDPARLSGALAAIMALMGELGLVAKLLAGSEKTSRNVAKILRALGASILEIALALYVVGQIDPDRLSGALGAIMALMGELALVAKLLAGSDKTARNVTKVITSLGVSLLLIAAALYVVGQIDPDRLSGALAAIMALMGELALVVKVLSGSKNLGGVSVALLAISVSLLIISQVCQNIASIKTDDLVKALVALTAILLELGIFIKLMSGTGGGAVVLGAALILISTGLLVLASALKAIGKLDIGKLAKAIITIGAFFAMLVIASNTVNPAGILAIGASLIMLSGAVFLLGAGVLAIVTAFGLLIGLAPLIISAGSSIIQALGIIITGIFTGLMNAALAVLPQILQFVHGLIIGLVEFLKEDAPTLVTSLISFLLVLLHAINDNITDILETLWGIIEKIGEFLYNKLDVIVEWLAKFIGKLLADLVMAIPIAIKTFVDEIVKKFKELFGINSPSKVFDEIGQFIWQGLVQGIVSGLTSIWQAGVDIITKLKEGIDNVWANVKEWFLSLPDKIKGWLDKVPKKALKAGKDIINKLKTGLEEKIEDIEDWFKDLPGNIYTWITDKMSKIEDIGDNIVKGLWNGINDAKEWICEKIEGFCDDVLDSIKDFFDIESPSKVMAQMGKYLDQGLGIGIEKNEDYALKPANSMAQSLQDALSNINPDDINANPVITPVIDLSNVESASGQIAGMFKSNTIGLNSNIYGIESSMRRIQNQDPNADLMSAINGLKDNINNNYTSYNVNGITYDDGSNIASAVQDLINATNVQRRM